MSAEVILQQVMEASGKNSKDEDTEDPDRIKNIYDSLEDAPQYPEDFEPAKGNKIVDQIKNEDMLDRLNEASPGDWVKVYQNGYIDGEKVSVHYSYNKTTKQYFDVEVWEGWSYK